jgi:hypothetical protein
MLDRSCSTPPPRDLAAQAMSHVDSYIWEALVWSDGSQVTARYDM